MNTPKPIVVLGDIMLDEFCHGEIKRLNPESSGWLLTVDRTEYKIGGAGNVANNLAALGAKTTLIGSTGKDAHAKELKNLLKYSKIDFVQLAASDMTIHKQRFIDHRVGWAHLGRADRDGRTKLTEKHRDRIISSMINNQCEYVIISDYEKGIITKELISSILQAGKKHGFKVIADAKPNHVDFFKDCFLIKPNFKEFQEIVGQTISNDNEKDIKGHGIALAKRLNTNLLVTRGDHGASFISNNGKYEHFKTEADPKEVFEVTGAGDTFIATLTYGLSIGMDVVDAIKLGNKAAGIVVCKAGTAVVTKKELGLEIEPYMGS